MSNFVHFAQLLRDFRMVAPLQATVEDEAGALCLPLCEVTEWFSSTMLLCHRPEVSGEEEEARRMLREEDGRIEELGRMSEEDGERKRRDVWGREG